MEFNIKNVCKVNEAKITADGITVIVGYNDTGKSTILKSIDVFLKTFGKKEKNIERERWNSVWQLLSQKDELFNNINSQTWMRRSMYEVCEELDKSNMRVEEIEYSYFKDVYLKVIREYIQYGIDAADEKKLSSDSFIKKLYDGIDEIKAIEQYDVIERNKKTLNDIFKVVLHGKLMNDDDLIKYHDDQIDELINLRNVASGMKSLLIIQRLVENGSLASGS